jgi:putative protease
MFIKRSYMKNIKKPILLSPVANYEMLIAAIDGGADAVYLGVKGQNMRESAKNFSKKRS